MKVLFIDFDGCINSSRFLESLQRSGGIITTWDHGDHIDPVRVEKLNRIVEATDCQVVVSSSWRLAHSLAELQQMFVAKGFVGTFQSVTPMLHGDDRWREIRAWLEAAPVIPDRFVIIDDDADAGVGFEDHFVRTRDGIEDEHVEQAIRILGGA